MKKHKTIGVAALAILFILSNLVLANPAGNGQCRSLDAKVMALAAGSWVCSKCGFHITTKSGNKPGPGNCSKNNNAAHDWEQGD